ncbi:MAG TPA: HAD family hydrolase, partial [Candidatus Saccharimonadales bacterium]|nr:HAD family hydrolase [Candidatus Saccharimonadales bacterium]
NLLFPHAPRRLTGAMWDEVYASLRPDELAYTFVNECRVAGLQIGLLSNINPTIAERLYVAGIYEGFDPVVLSCYTNGFAKPDPEIYAMVEARLPAGTLPSEILFLDDQDKCVIGAQQRGWNAIKVTSSEQMIREAGSLLGIS